MAGSSKKLVVAEEGEVTPADPVSDEKRVHAYVYGATPPDMDTVVLLDVTVGDEPTPETVVGAAETTRVEARP